MVLHIHVRTCTNVNMHIHTRTRTCTHTHIGNPGRPLQTFGASRARRLMKASVTKIAIYKNNYWEQN